MEHETSTLVLPESAKTEETRLRLKKFAQDSTYFMGKAVLGFVDMTPQLHKEMCTWIDSPTKRKHGIVPRGHLKTSVWTIANSIRRITRDSNIRILIGNETATNSSHWLQKVEKVWERNALFQWLFPEIIPDFGRHSRWNQTEMLVPREMDYPEATIEVIGVGGAVVSRHYNLIKLDDLVGKEASESAEVMRKTIDWYQYCESLLEDLSRDEIHNFGTPWGFNDLDAWVRRNEGDWTDFFFRSCFTVDHVPIWQERFSDSVFEKLRKKYGAYKFSCQYLCQPVNPDSGSLEEKDLRWYDWRSGYIVPRSGNLVGVIDPYKSLTRYMRVDPAVSEKAGAARSAIIVDGIYRDDRIFVLEEWAKRCQPYEMIEKIFELAEKWQPDAIGVESVAYQRILKPLIEREAELRGVWLNIIPLNPDTHERKENRIRGRIQPIAAQGRLWVCDDLPEFLEEYKTFPHGMTLDLIDAFAYGPDMWNKALEDDGSEELAAEVFANQLNGRSEITGY